MAQTINDDAGEPQATELLDAILTPEIQNAIAEGRLRFQLKYEMFRDDMNEETCMRPNILIEPA
jgi:hypothetical protein